MWRIQVGVACLAGALLCGPANLSWGQTCAVGTAVYDMTGSTCPNGDQRCNFSTGMYFYEPAASGTPVVLMPTGYDLNVYKVTSLTQSTQAWQEIQINAFQFAREYRSLNRLLFEVDVDPETQVGIAPYQDKPVRIFRVTPGGTVQELWRNPFDGSYPNISTTGVVFSLPAGSARRQFAVWGRNGTMEIFEVLLGPPVEVVSRHDTGVPLLTVAVKRGNPTYLYAIDSSTRSIRVFRVSLNASGDLEVLPTSTLQPFSSGLDAFSGLAIDRSTGRLYTSAYKVVNSTSTFVECWETAANPAQPTYRSRIQVPQSVISGTHSARDGWVLAAAGDRYSNLVISFHNPDAPQILATYPKFPLAAGDTQRYEVRPTGGAIVRDPNGNYGGAHAHVEWGALSWFNPACANTQVMAGVGITRVGNTGTPSCQVSGVAAHGFPGDGFTLTDESTGQNYTVTELKVTGVDSHNGAYQWLATPPARGGSVTWPAAENLGQWGRFRVSLTITRPDNTTDTATRDLYLCNTPVARVGVTATRQGSGSWVPCTTCTWLRNDWIKLSAASSDGNPELGQTQWQVFWRDTPQGTFEPVSAQDGQVLNWQVNPQGELELDLLRAGQYRAEAQVLYAFDPGQRRSAETPPLTSAAVFPAIRLEQPQGTVIPEGASVRSTPPVLLVSQEQLASGWSVQSYAWEVKRIGTGVVATGSNPQLEFANLEDTASYEATLVVTATDLQSQESASAVRNFTVQNVTGSFTWSPTNPQIGEETAFAPSGLSGGINSLRWTFGSDPLCDGSGPQLVKPCIPDTCVGTSVRFSQPGTRTVTLEASVGGTWLPVSSQQVTVQNTGTCVTCVAPSAPAPSLPLSGATVSPNQPVPFSWSPSSGTGPITYRLRAQSQFRNEVCDTTTATSCSITFTVGGTYHWWVEATNSCGSAQSALRTLTVQSSQCTPPDAPAPVSPAAGATLQAGSVTFSWQGVSGATGYSVQLQRNGFPSGSCTPTPATGTSCSITIHGAGQYSWTVTANNSCGSATSPERSFTVTSPCGTLGAPALLEPGEGTTLNGASVTFRWQAPAQGQGPFTYDLFVDNFRRGVELLGTEHEVQNLAAGAHTWYVVARDSCNQTTNSATRTFTATSCAVTAPQPNFTWEPKGPDPHFPQQMQPFAGQEVTLVYTGSGGRPEYYKWFDFQQTPPRVVEGPAVTEVKHTWTSVSGEEYQDMNVRLLVRNCAGSPPELLKGVRIYKDIRPVLALFTTAGPLVAGQPSRFVALTGASEGNPTRFEWDFGDGSAKVSGTQAEVEHTYACGRTYQVTLTAWRGSTRSNATTKAVLVGGRPCAPEALVVPDIAVNQKANLDGREIIWQSRVRLFNPESRPITTEVLARTRDNRQFQGQLSIPAGGYASLGDLVGVLRDGQGKPPDNLVVTLWLTAAEGERLPVAGARTFTEPAGGGTYGQAVPVYALYPPESNSITLWVEGAEHTGTINGFRANLTVVNPSTAGWGASKGITLTLYSALGQTYTKRLTAFAGRRYNRYNPITDLFGLDKETDLGDFTLRVDVDPGVTALVGCSVNDNRTNDSFFLLAQPDVD